MKKILASVLLANLLLANNTLYEIKPMVGYVDTKDNVDIKNHKVVGVGVSKDLTEQYLIDELELSILQSKDVDYRNSSEDTKITLFSVNGIKNYKITENFELYALGGLGYERISDSEYGNESDPFFNYGVGVGYSLPNDLSIKVDARHELKFDNDKNIIYTVGLSIPFGQKNASKKKEVKKFEMKKKDDMTISNVNKDLSVLFEVDSYTIKDSDINAVKEYAQYIKTVPNVKIVLEGHTDSTGTESYNMKLSQKRANSAKEILRASGISEDKITTIGYGETKPFVPNDTIENRQKNRRVIGQLK